MSRRTALLTAALAATALAGAAAWTAWRRPIAPESPRIATVNGVAITQRDARLRLSELLPAAAFHGNVPPAKLLALRRTALDELILEELIWQEATAAGLEPDARVVDGEVASVRSRFGSDRDFAGALEANGLTNRSFRQHMARAVLLRQVRQARVPADPTEMEVEAYYERNAGKFLRPEQVHLLEILAAADPAGGRPAERAARAKANGVLRRLRRGEDFGAVAWAESDDAHRVKNGDLGWVHRGRLDPDLEAAVFAAPVGELRQVRSLAGFHVFKAVAREPERQLTLDEARPIIVERLRRTRREAAEKTWHNQLRASASIVILDGELRAATPLEILPPNLAPGPPAGGTPVAAPSH